MHTCGDKQRLRVEEDRLQVEGKRLEIEEVRKRKAQLILMSNGHYSKCKYQCATGVGAAFNLVNCFLLVLCPRLVFFY